MDDGTFDLGWLDPTVDRCRDLLAQRGQFRHWTKRSVHDGSDEAVTELDLAVEALLIEAIHERLPHAAILSEESNPDPSALSAETCFVIDPIDGTKELIAGRSGFAISIALFHRGQPVAALLDMPAHDRRFQGTAGGGTYLNGRPAAFPRFRDLSHVRLAVSSTQLHNESLRPFWANISAAALIPTPAFAAKIAAILGGDCDAALYLPVNPHPTAIWDYSAPALLLAEVGGSISTVDGEDLLRRRPFKYIDGWAAGPIGLRDQLLDVLGRVTL